MPNANGELSKAEALFASSLAAREAKPLTNVAQLHTFESARDFLESFADARKFGLNLSSSTNFRLYFDKEGADNNGIMSLAKRSEAVYKRFAAEAPELLESLETDYDKIGCAVQMLDDTDIPARELDEMLDVMQTDPILQLFYQAYQLMATRSVDQDDYTVRLPDGTTDPGYLLK